MNGDTPGRPDRPNGPGGPKGPNGPHGPNGPNGPNRPNGPIRRIVVALDASADSLAALEASAELAAALDAELVGLYVEDVNVLRLVGRTAATEIDLLSGRRRSLGRSDLERQLRVQAARARRTLERTAGGLAVRWSFRTVRGRPSHELLAEAADLITLGVRGHGPGRGPGSTVLRLLDATGSPVLVTRRGAALGADVFVLHDGDGASDRAVALGARLAVLRGAPLTVLLTGPDESAGRESGDRADGNARASERATLMRIRTRVAAVAKESGTGLPLHLRRLPTPDTDSLLTALRHHRCGLLVLPRSGPLGDLRLLLRQAHCPVLVVE